MIRKKGTVGYLAVNQQSLQYVMFRIFKIVREDEKCEKIIDFGMRKPLMTFKITV